MKRSLQPRPKSTFVYPVIFVFLLLALAQSTFAQPFVNIDLEVSRMPRDGITMAQIDIGEQKASLARIFHGNYASTFRAGDATYNAQIIPRPDFDAGNHKAVVLIAAPGKNQLRGELHIAPVSGNVAQSIRGAQVIATNSAQWEFNPQKSGVLPSKVTLTPSGETYTKYYWADRVVRTINTGNYQQYYVARDKNSSVTIISNGPIATVVRGSAYYVDEHGERGTGDPQAVYDWYFFKDSPLVFVDATQRASARYAWNESHFLEWNFQEKYFSRYAGYQSAPTPLTSSKKVTQSSHWLALLSGKAAVAYLNGATIYDGVDDFGNYIRPRDPSSGPWDGATRRMTAWLWVSDTTASNSLSAQLDALDDTASMKFTDSSIETTENVPKIPLKILNWPRSLGTSSAIKTWLQSLVQRKLSSNKNAEIIIPSTWQFALSGDLGIALDVRKTGADIISLYDLGENKELSADEAVPLFEIGTSGTNANEVTSLNASNGWRDVTFQKTARGFSLSFRSNAMENISIFTNAEALTHDSAWAWNINIDNKNSGRNVQNVIFPQIKLRRLSGHSAALVPIRSGLVSSAATNYSEAYPSGSATMQFLAVYQDGKNSTGLYAGRHDSTASDKTLQLSTDKFSMERTLTFSQPAEDLGIPNNTFHFGGTGVWKLLHGDWYDAARYYKSWVQREAPWWPTINDNGRVDTPTWFKSLNAWALASYTETTISNMTEMQKFLGQPIGWHAYNWHQIPFDNDYPHYFPAKDGFENNVQSLQKNNIHVMPYINGRLWDTRDKGLDDFEFTKRALPWATKTMQKGSLLPYTSSFHSTESDGSKVSLAVMCPSTPLWQDTVTGIVKKLTADMGMSGVYIDQIGAARPILCMDSTHGHPLGGGHWWVDGYNQMLRQIQENIPTNSIITTEDNAEPYMKYLDGMLSWSWMNDGQVPAYTVIYGSAVQVFGRSMNSSGEPNIAIPMKTGQELVFGEQIGWLDPQTLLHKIDNDARNYFKQTVQVRGQINPYISEGEMLRPPTLTGNSTVTADWAWGGAQIITTNAVLTGAWKKYGANKIAMVFTNVKREAQSVQLTFNPGEYGIKGKAHIQQWDTTSGSKKDLSADKSTFALNLPALSTIIWKISWE